MTSVLFYNPDRTPEELAHSSPTSHNDANWPWPKTNNPHDNTHDTQSWKKDDTKPPKIPGLARLNILQGFSLLGGAGSMVHEIHAVEYQKALMLASSEGRYRPRCTFNSTDKAEVPTTATTTTTTDVTTTEKERTEGVDAVARGGGEQLWPWSWAQKLQSVTTGSRGTMKRYRITIEELPGEVSADGSALASTSASATSTVDVSASEAGVGAGLEEVEVVKKVATTTAMMPTGVVEWLLNVSYDKPYGFRAPAVEEKKGGDESTESAVAVVIPVIAAVDEVVPQVPLPDHDLSSSSSVPVAVVAAGTVAPSTAASSGGAGPEPVATKIESPVAATSAASTVVDQIAVASATPVPAKASEASEAVPSSVLVNKVMEVRPFWDNNNDTSQDTSRTREWPPHRYQHQRRPSESFARTTITRPDGTIESKTVTFNRQSGVTETHTRIQRPDGSFLETSTHRINPSLREAQEKEQQEQQQQLVPQTRHEGGNPYRNHLNRVASQQQQQQQRQNDAGATAAAATIAAASTSTPPTPPSSSSSPSQHRPSFRERWAQRRQEHREFLEDLRAERERERSHISQDRDQERGCQDDRRRERRQELRDAEARQREATAAAYGFVPSSSSSVSESASTSSSSNRPSVEHEDHRHHHRDRLRRRGRKDEDEENDNREGRQQYRSRSWPPKGYLKRQEREQQEQQQPRHNV